MDKLAQDFHTRVKTTLEEEHDQTILYDNLKKYKQDQDLSSLVNTLKSLLASPDRVALFDDVRPFVSVNQQVEFNNLCPPPPNKKASLVYLTRHGTEPLGFKFRGGLEHGVGLYVSEITPGSQAELKGLRPGDEIIQVNGLNVTQVTHNEALAAMKLKKMLSLKVKGTGLVPIRDSIHDPISWKFVDTNKPSPDRSSAYDLPVDVSRNLVAQERTVFVNLEDGQRLGCGISSGRHQPGIFIHKVTPGTLAEKLGFQVGDQIMSVNKTSFQDISHSEALVELKSSKQLNIVLRSWVDGGFQVEPTPAPSREVDDSAATYATVQKRNERIVQASAKGVIAANIVIGQSVLEEERPPPEPVPVVEPPPPIPVIEQNVPAWYKGDPNKTFTTRQIDGRELRKVAIVKDGPLDMYLEGGIDSPLGGKLIVAEVIKDGAAARSGLIAKGDQIMMLEGKKMIDIKLEEAQQAFREEMSGPLDGSQIIRMIIAVSPPKQYEDEVTYF